MIWALLACTPANELPSRGFHIEGSTPEDGEPAVVEAQIPELRFSEPIDPELCGPHAIRIDGIHVDGSVAFSVELEVVSLDDGVRVQLTHEDTFPTAWTYAMSVAAGGEGSCTSLEGEPLEPFMVTFGVP